MLLPDMKICTVALSPSVLEVSQKKNISCYFDKKLKIYTNTTPLNTLLPTQYLNTKKMLKDLPPHKLKFRSL